MPDARTQRTDSATDVRVEIYGQDHSPWVQAVLLGLYLKGIPHSLRTVPPFRVFRDSGILMPAASIGAAPWRLQSAEILQEFGYDAVSDEDMLALFRALRGGVNRVNSARSFWYEWSFVRDPNPSLGIRLRNQFLRSFSILYFYLAVMGLVRRGQRPRPGTYTRQFKYWDDKVRQSSGSFMNGEEPGILDVMFFAVVQCHCSIPVEQIETLQQDPELMQLRAWIGVMQDRCKNYPHLYSGIYFTPYLAAPSPTTLLERSFFWLGTVTTLLAFPITVPLARYYIRRVRRRGLLRMPERGAAPLPAETRQVDVSTG